MIEPQVLRKKSRDTSIQLDIIEKDYILGWMLFGITQSSIANDLVFKGGTALSKIYFPENWRLSEDLDFTSTTKPDWKKISTAITDEIPDLLKKSRIPITIKEKIHTNPNYFQSKLHYQGPIGTGKIKIEISEEKEMGPVNTIEVPRIFDYPKFSVKVYTLENIFAEKLRSIIQRGKIRDYYDAWRLLNEGKIKNVNADLFLKKCKAKDIEYTGIEQLFPDKIEETLKKFLPNVTRMSNKEIDLNKIIPELRASLKSVKGL